jgi:DNA processing protein
MERAAWVALSGVTGLGPARFRRLLEGFGSALEALQAGPAEICACTDLPDSAAACLAEIPTRLEAIGEELVSLEEQGVRPLVWEDADYPARLLSTSSPPPVLWQTGSADLNDRAVAVVGSREASPEALSLARALASTLAKAGVTVVSGLAAGIDAAAHEGAVEAGGLTVGVCGCGVLTALMRGQEGLAGRVARAGGLCSELSPAAPLLPQTLHARDRIIAGLGEAVIVVEARAGGGAVHTAKCALREGRPALAVKWPDDHSAPGNRELLGEGATALPRDQNGIAQVFDLPGLRNDD